MREGAKGGLTRFHLNRSGLAYAACYKVDDWGKVIASDYLYGGVPHCLFGSDVKGSSKKKAILSFFEDERYFSKENIRRAKKSEKK